MERHRMAEHTRYERLYGLFLAYAALLALFGLIMDTPVNILRGLSTIILTEDALITDYVLIAGPGAALVNSALVTAISTLILRRSGEPFNGFSPVVVGLMSGFSLFGKNFVNIWPILLGTFLYAKSRREPVGKYAPVGLLATALAPVVSYIALDNGWGTPLAGGLVGILIGFIMPPLSAYTYKIQNGMNLYNVGFACGLVAFILVPLMGSMGATPPPATTGRRAMTSPSASPSACCASPAVWPDCSAPSTPCGPPGRVTAAFSRTAAGRQAISSGCSAPALCCSTQGSTA